MVSAAGSDDTRTQSVGPSQLRSAGSSYRRIAALLTAEGRSTKRGGVWAAMTARNIADRQDAKAEPEAR